jgi:pyruvate kinase
MTGVSRRTKILATLGPATHGEAGIRSLLEAGADAIRLNFSHGTHSEHEESARLVRMVAQGMGKAVSLVQDLQGSKIRVGSLKGGSLRLSAGMDTSLSTAGGVGDGDTIPIDYAPLPREVQPGDRILLGDGEVELEVLSTGGDRVRVRVINEGILKANQGVHLPGVSLAVQSPTKKDVADLKFGLELGVDFVALSFVRSAKDIRRLKRAMRDSGREVPVIAKLEKREVLDTLDDIIAAADGVMVARGDLGLELELERVPLVQKEIIRKANERGTLVITATQMLESMIDSPRPTRAEASDVANAILDGTDAVMLSGETAIGRYPAEAVRMMGRIAAEAETASVSGGSVDSGRPSHAYAMSRAARGLAEDIGASAIIVFTRSGYSAELVSKERPRVPIFAFTPREDIFNRLALWWGVTPLLLSFPRTAEGMIEAADACLTSEGLMQAGDTAIVARWSSMKTRGWSNFVKIHRLIGGR